MKPELIFKMLFAPEWDRKISRPFCLSDHRAVSCQEYRTKYFLEMTIRINMIDYIFFAVDSVYSTTTTNNNNNNQPLLRNYIYITDLYQKPLEVCMVTVLQSMRSIKFVSQGSQVQISTRRSIMVILSRSYAIAETAQQISQRPFPSTTSPTNFFNPIFICKL
jgi:hypothetical protein